MTEWEDAQASELAWWGDCASTFGEEAKQISYAARMGLLKLNIDGKWPVYDAEGKSILDIGGGPCSMLLKVINAKTRVVIDPAPYPDWVTARYRRAGIAFGNYPAEMMSKMRGVADYDECWLYNVLQHVEDPAKVIENARAAAPVIRIFEWINVPPHQGHPHELTRAQLDEWLGQAGAVEDMDENGAVGTAYYSIVHRVASGDGEAVMD